MTGMEDMYGVIRYFALHLPFGMRDEGAKVGVTCGSWKIICKNESCQDSNSGLLYHKPVPNHWTRSPILVCIPFLFFYQVSWANISQYDLGAELINTFIIHCHFNYITGGQLYHMYMTHKQIYLLSMPQIFLYDDTEQTF